MHTHQFFTWTTHTAETTTLLEATRLQKLYTYMCNIVTEFYLYSIVYVMPTGMEEAPKVALDIHCLPMRRRGGFNLDD